MKSMFKKNAISGSVKPPFTAKNRRYRDCLLVLPTAARRSARSSGLRARISTRHLSRNISTAEYLAASDMAVCTENSVLFDCVIESPNVSGYDRSALALPGPVRLAVQVEEPT